MAVLFVLGVVLVWLLVGWPQMDTNGVPKITAICVLHIWQLTDPWYKNYIELPCGMFFRQYSFIRKQAWEGRPATRVCLMQPSTQVWWASNVRSVCWSSETLQTQQLFGHLPGGRGWISIVFTTFFGIACCPGWWKSVPTASHQPLCQHGQWQGLVLGEDREVFPTTGLQWDFNGF